MTMTTMCTLWRHVSAQNKKFWQKDVLCMGTAVVYDVSVLALS